MHICLPPGDLLLEIALLFIQIFLLDMIKHRIKLE